jgi:hypothetical protein
MVDDPAARAAPRAGSRPPGALQGRPVFLHQAGKQLIFERSHHLSLVVASIAVMLVAVRSRARARISRIRTPPGLTPGTLAASYGRSPAMSTSSTTARSSAAM